jgi:hypothetical protein
MGKSEILRMERKMRSKDGPEGQVSIKGRCGIRS